jgi:DNA repair exonuclease SbcCD ATPase subunit
MIPLRVYLKNFLCHAEQEFRFDEHPVWLLHGPNGVGKSAIFDAMLYALYGESKRSDSRKNAVADVIRHGEASMRVEFDFEICGQRYQVWRTRARSGQPKQGVNQWKQGSWSPIRDVNGTRELDEWVKGTLGLNYDTFVSAILLRQGAAEKLIDAEKDTRRELFRSFIDLDPYLRLHERVTEARAGVSADIRQTRARLSGMPVITDHQIAAATTAAQTAEEQLQNARTLEIASRNRLGHARAWEQYEVTRRRIQGELDASADRSRRSAELEKQIGRLRQLKVLVPGLTRVRELQGALVTVEETLKLRSEEQGTAIACSKELNAALAGKRAEIGVLRGKVAEFDRQILEADAEQKRLSAEIGRAGQAADLHQRLGTLRKKQFDPNLDNRVDSAEQAATEAQSIKDALPHVEPLVKHRADYHRAVADDRTATDNVTAAGEEVERLRQAETVAQGESQAATNRKGEAEQAAAVAQDQHEKAIERRDRFATTAMQPVCSECGQPIDATHAAKEWKKLDLAVKTAETNLERCRGEVTAATTDATAAQDRHRQAETDYRTAQQQHGDAVRARDDARSRKTTAQKAFDQALGALDEPFASRVAAIAGDGFPTADDVVEMRAIAKELAARIRARDGLLQCRRDREQTTHDIGVLEQSVAAIGAPADVTVARADLGKIETSLSGLRDTRAEADNARGAAEECEGQLLTQQQELGGKITQLSGDVAAARADVTSAQKQLDTAIALVPDSHRSRATTIAESELQALTDELADLQGGQVEEEFAALAQDRVLQADRERQLSEVERQIGQVPPDARRCPCDVEKEVSDAEAASGTAEQLRDEARTRLGSLAGQRDQRCQTQQHLDDAERSYSLHDRLAGLLGAEGIQLDLVRGAERRIIARADEILGRLSTGELRFEPPDAESSRPFDLSVRRRDCPQPIAVGNLSGGQRFRVAVSLALAVCQGAGDAARPLESVIIDEGFGALDREGRMAMITELRDGQTLAGMFKRVLVVSHQDDFSAAFPVGYRLRLEAGITMVESFGTAADAP